MRRRHAINVWPAFADLMTVLAVVGLFVGLALLSVSPGDAQDVKDQLDDALRRQRTLEAQLKRAQALVETGKQAWTREREALRGEIREAAKNQQMFQAIQAAQEFIDQTSSSSGLTFSADQSLQFGDDLVSFKLNSLKPIWRKDGRQRLHTFCRSLSEARTHTNTGHFFLVQVEGHTDSLACPGDPNCNWWISSGRAAAFVEVMHNSAACPGGDVLDLRPIGFADRRPARPGEAPTRRIAVRLVPNYEKIIESWQTPFSGQK